MGTISQKLNRIKQTKNELKDAINIGGGQITNNTVFNDYADEIKNIYIDAINNGTENIYNNFPKTTGEGSEIILDTEKGAMNITLEGNASQNTNMLPEEYTQVDYIESSGTQYIDTGINADNNLRVILDIAYTEPTTSNQNIGAIRLESGNNARYHLLPQSNYFKVYVNDGGYSTINIDTNRHLFDIKPSLEIATVDNQDFTIPSGIRNVNLNFWLFARNSTSTKYYTKAKQWACKMYYSDVLVRDFIPCYRNSDNEVGLYDIVNNVFHTNQGTGSFTYGSVVDIPNPDYPQNIEVVTGGQNIKIEGKNLFKPVGQTNKGITATVNEDGSVSYSGTATADYSNLTKMFYKDLPSGKYTLSINKTLDYQVRIRVYYEDDSYQVFAIYVGNSSRTFAVTKKIVSYYVYIADLESGKEYNDTLYFQFESGGLTPYEPYKEQNYPISLSSKNLFDKEENSVIYSGIQTSESALSTGKRITALTASSSTIQYAFKLYRLIDLSDYVGKVVRMKTNFSKSNNNLEPMYRIGLCNADGTSRINIAQTNVSSAEISFTVPNLTENAKYLAVWLYLSLNTDIAQNDYVDYTDIIVTVDNQDMTYEPYYNIEYCKIRDYADQFFKNTTDSEFYDSTLIENEWYLKKKIGKVILNGGSNESYEYQNNHRFWLRRSYWANETVPFNPPQNTLQGLYCNRFVERTRSQTWAGTEGISYDNPNTTDQPIGSTFDIACNSVASNENDFKTWLSSNNLIVYYILQNINIIHISEIEYPTLKAELEDIYSNAKSSDKETMITQTTEGLPFILDISALAKIE